MKLKIIVVFFIGLFALYFLTAKDLRHSSVSMLSVSSDGKYVLSVHHGKYLILWDIDNKSKTTINKDANIFSAYFIKNSHQFIWQDIKTNTVHVQDISLKEVKKFTPGFAAYGHVITPNLENYIASDKEWNLIQLTNKHRYILKKGFDDYDGYGKLLNLSISEGLVSSSGSCGYKGEQLPISDGLAASDKNKGVTHNGDYSFMPCVTLYSINQHAAIKKFSGLSAKTIATLSPDGHYLVAGDENTNFKRWELTTNKIIEADYPQIPAWLKSCYGNENCIKEVKHDLATKKRMPKDFFEHPYANGLASVAIKFINEQGDYIRFMQAVNYAILYNVNSPEVLEYLNLGKSPQPDTFNIAMSANTIDTAPKANILVMGQAAFGDMPLDKGTGIIVYRFDPKTKKLTRIWAPDGPPPHPVRKDRKR